MNIQFISKVLMSMGMGVGVFLMFGVFAAVAFGPDAQILLWIIGGAYGVLSGLLLMRWLMTDSPEEASP